MVSFISVTTLLLLSISNQVNVISADTCRGDDPLACALDGVCRDGIKDYEDVLKLDHSVGMMPQQKRGMHCECPNDNGDTKYGMSGLHCKTAFERCGDNSVCFNGGFCERDSNNLDMYHCGCPQDEKFKVWAGKSCENEATDFCGTNDQFFDITGTSWFCTNGGECLTGETDLSKKCDCPAGYYGLHCEFDEIHSCDLQCLNNGECKKGAKDFSQYIDYGLDIDHFLGGTNKNGEHCVCPNGYTGLYCEKVEGINYRECGKGVCFNGGICVERVNSMGKPKNYHCECSSFDTNVAGQFCEHANVEFCPAPDGHDASQYYCTNGGRCPLNELHGACTDCDDGWTGTRCETRVKNEVVVQERNDCDLDCRNGGTCFFGDHPLEDGKLKQIEGLEFLQDNKHCRCPNGYIGLRCEMRYERCGAGEHYCLHGSGCVPDNDQFTCDCNEVSSSLVAYAGHYCEHTSEEFCLGPGAGKHSFCTEHGTCRGEIGIGQDHVGCDCEEGWTGEYCEFKNEQLRTDGIATKAFVGFMTTLIAILSFAGIFYWMKTKRNNMSAYETAANHDVHANPYGDDNDDDSSDDDDDDEYELKEVTII